jgi:hypothetical protein
MTTKKKKYEKPAMQVFKLKQQPQILAGSANRDPYGNPIPGNWE